MFITERTSHTHGGAHMLQNYFLRGFFLIEFIYFCNLRKIEPDVFHVPHLIFGGEFPFFHVSRFSDICTSQYYPVGLD